MLLLAAFTAACTQTNTEEEYEMEIQVIDKDELQPPGERKKKGEKDED